MTAARSPAANASVRSARSTRRMIPSSPRDRSAPPVREPQGDGARRARARDGARRGPDGARARLVPLERRVEDALPRPVAPAPRPRARRPRARPVAPAREAPLALLGVGRRPQARALAGGARAVARA